MNIQVFGIKGNKDTRKALRFFSDRGIGVHFVDLKERALSAGELDAICRVIPAEELIDKDSKLYTKQNLRYMVFDVKEKLLEEPLLFKMPIVRASSQVTLGFQPDIWKKLVI